MIQAFLLLLAASSLFFALGIHRRILAIFLWYGSTSILNQIPFLSIPSEGFVGWLLIASSLIPAQEPYRVSLKKQPLQEWNFPELLYPGAWCVFSTAYILSGIEKLHSLSWIDGSALEKIWLGPTSRPSIFLSILINLPKSILHFLSWFTLAFEIFIPFFGFFAKTRFLSWIGLTIFHVSILFTLNLTEISVLMLISQLFLYNKNWNKYFKREITHMLKKTLKIT